MFAGVVAAIADHDQHLFVPFSLFQMFKSDGSGDVSAA